MKLSQVGLIGLGVMGANLALNLLHNGYSVSVFNRKHQGRESAVEHFVSMCGKLDVLGTEDLSAFVESLKRPRKIILMVKAGEAVDEVITNLLPLLEKDDIVIDGGNSDYRATSARVRDLEDRGILFVGAGISGGEEGARNGASIMVGGNPRAWTRIRPILQAVAAKCADGTPCCKWLGEGGVGHFVKMVHNGIEYADMQLISEAYFILKTRNKLSNDEIADFFDECNRGELGGYLIEITSQILRAKDSAGGYIVDGILDSAAQKGTGKWTIEAALDVGAPIPTIATAVFARFISAMLDERKRAAAGFARAKKNDAGESAEVVRCAMMASKIIVYEQGFSLLKHASQEFNWNLDFASIARVWRNGCIIRSAFLDKIARAYKNAKLESIFFDEYFMDALSSSLLGLRKTVSAASMNAVAVPCFSSALSYFDSLTCANSAANLIQAQRDFFGAHTYERVDLPRGVFFHTDWQSEIDKVKSKNSLQKAKQ